MCGFLVAKNVQTQVEMYENNTLPKTCSPWHARHMFSRASSTFRFDGKPPRRSSILATYGSWNRGWKAWFKSTNNKSSSGEDSEAWHWIYRGAGLSLGVQRLPVSCGEHREFEIISNFDIDAFCCKRFRIDSFSNYFGISRLGKAIQASAWWFARRDKPLPRKLAEWSWT